LIRPGDKVLLEEPVYPGLKNIFLEAGAELTGIPVQSDGMETAQIERAMARGRFKVLVVTSNFQNPTGATLSMEARQSILRQAGSMGAVIVENDIYGQLRYEGTPLPTLKQMDDTGDTILLRSFSKISFPGLRVGWVTGPRAVIARMMEAKHLSDLHSDQLSQAVLLRFAVSGRLETHHARMLKAGAERLRAVLVWPLPAARNSLYAPARRHESLGRPAGAARHERTAGPRAARGRDVLAGKIFRCGPARSRFAAVEFRGPRSRAHREGRKDSGGHVFK
jgi:DNA-binding transcriptional MocR family regulator